MARLTTAIRAVTHAIGIEAERKLADKARRPAMIHCTSKDRSANETAPGAILLDRVGRDNYAQLRPLLPMARVLLSEQKQYELS
jgi:hypothetical protein